MLRVLTLSTLFSDATRPRFGGFVARQTADLAALPDTQVTVVAPIGLPPWPLTRLSRYAALAALPRDERWDGLEVHRPRFTTLPGTGGRFHAAALARAIAPLVERIAPDVIDAEFFFPDGVAAAALGRRLGIPMSIKARGSDVHHWGRARATAGQVRAAAHAADGLLAVSAAMADDMVALGLPRPRIHYTGVDLARFTPADRTAAKATFGVSGPLVVSAGTLDDNKGHAIVIDAIARLPGVTLLIAGEGPNRAALERQVAPLGERVRLLGSTPHDALARLLAAADAFALASAREGLANVWVEALASGTPLVITDAGGAREVVTAPVYGRVVARTPDAFAHALAKILADPPAPGAVRAGAERFSWAENARSLRAHLAALV